MGRKVYHVVPRQDGGWAGELEGGKRASVVGETKADVLSRTIEIAKEQGHSQVIVHKENGVIQEERTYGEDPYPPRG